MKDERIRNLEDINGWLRLEYSKKDAQLSQFLLPAAQEKPIEKKRVYGIVFGAKTRNYNEFLGMI